jgi:hypothetical protein
MREPNQKALTAKAPRTPGVFIGKSSLGGLGALAVQNHIHHWA